MVDALNGNSFEDLAPLFLNNQFNHGVISMTFEEAGLLFRVVRTAQPRRILEVGRFKGGSTVLLAAAAPQATIWSIDNNEKESRLGGLPHDDELRAFLQRSTIENVELLVGDSRTIAFDVEDLDMVFLDGDHTYEGVSADIDRFGSRLRVGCDLLLHDAVSGHPDTVGRAMREVVAAGLFRIVDSAGSLARLQRLR